MNHVWVIFTPDTQTISGAAAWENGINSNYIRFDDDGKILPDQDNNFAALRAKLSDPHNPLPLYYWYGDRKFAATPAEADPPHFLYEPLPWMLAQNPFEPRPSTWQVLTIDGWNKMPVSGSENLLYLLKDGDEHMHLDYDKSTGKYRTPTGAGPNHSDVKFHPEDDAIVLYNETGTDAGTPVGAVKVPFEVVSSGRTLPASKLSQNTARTILTAHEALALKFTFNEFAGTAAAGANDAVWYDSDAAAPATGQPSSSSFVAKIVRKRGTTETVLQEIPRSDTIAPSSNFWYIHKIELRIAMQANDELYVTVEALSNSTEADPRSKSITPDPAALLTIEAFATETALDVRELIRRRHTTFNGEQLAENAIVYRNFDTPVPLDEFDKLMIGIRFARTEADFYRNVFLDLNGYSLLADRAAAESHPVLGSGSDDMRRITIAGRTDTQGRIDCYRGHGWTGWDDVNNLLYRIWSWFWGDSGYVRGVKMSIFVNQASDSNIWLTQWFERGR